MLHLSSVSRWVLTLAFFAAMFSVTPSTAQTTRVDSLLKRLALPMPDTSRLSTLRKLSAAYTSVDPLKKLATAQAVKALAERLGDEKAIADAYSDMGVSCSIRSKNDSALYYFTAGYKQAEKVNYLAGMGKCLTNTGYTYDRLDNNTESIKYYFQALAIFKKIHLEKGINQCNTNIGSIYFDLGQFNLALTYFNPVLASYTRSQDQQGLGYALFTVGNCYSELGQTARALSLFNRSLAIREKLGDLSGLALVHRSLAILYKNTGRYTLALQHLEKGLPIVQKLHDRYLEGSTIMVLSETYEGMKDYPAAKKYALQGLAIGKEIGSKLMSSEALLVLANSNKNTGHLREALEYQVSYTELKDSILNERVLKSVTMTELGRIRVENSALANDNRVIHSKNTDNLSKLDNYSRQLLITGLCLLLALLTALILYFRNKAKQATNKLLLQQKEQIASINRELEALNEEIVTQNETTNAQNLELARLNTIKNKFFSIVSHDLRNPLNTLRSLFAIYRLGDLNKKELDEFLSKLEGSVIETGSFLDNLLEWAKSQMDGIKIKPVDFDITESIVNNIRLHEVQANLKKLTISSTIDAPVIVRADQDMINLVIRNLLSNSVKFCDFGDTITLSAKTAEGKAVVAIADTGRGIDPASAENLFNLEHTLSTGTQGEKGNGLGLILCRDMIEMNGGTIWFQSEPGKGTTFFFDLNIA